MRVPFLRFWLGGWLWGRQGGSTRAQATRAWFGRFETSGAPTKKGH
jgi:hypothetical protein